MFTNAENVHTGGITKGRFSEYQHYYTQKVTFPPLFGKKIVAEVLFFFFEYSWYSEKLRRKQDMIHLRVPRVFTIILYIVATVLQPWTSSTAS